jgi:ribosome-associated translation inhibitor RaiA
MQTPVDIAFRHCEPSEEIRSEIAAQVQRLEKFSPRITSCRVVVTGPQTGHRRGGFEVELRIAMPDHNKVVVDKSHADAPEREHALVAIREAFDAAVRQIENVMRESCGSKPRPRQEPPRQGRLRLHRNSGRAANLFSSERRPRCGLRPIKGRLRGRFRRRGGGKGPAGEHRSRCRRASPGLADRRSERLLWRVGVEKSACAAADP